MISEGVIYEAGEIFRMLEESDPGRRGGSQGQAQPQGQAKRSSDDMYSGYCENGQLVWHFLILDDSSGENEYAGQFAHLDHTDNSVNVNLDDGYKEINKIDSDYERMMKRKR